MQERERIKKSKELLMKIAQGADPITGETIPEDSFLNDPNVIRCFCHASDILDNVLNGAYSKHNKAPFRITSGQIERVQLPESKMGVNAFSRCINDVLDIGSRNLTGMELNKRLKRMGILSESTDGDGKTVTITNDDSSRYGFEMEHRSRNGREYDMVLINDTGKKYLLENMKKIMALEIPA